MTVPALAIADAALALASGHGWPVFPCQADKKPATRQGFKNATTHPALISMMFGHAPMIGVPTGRETFVTIDVDVKGEPSGMAWLDANRHRLPATRTHRTGSGGVHLLFLHPLVGPDSRNSAGALAPHVDVRGVGGYVIAPPSPGYSVADDVPIAPMPEWLVEACRTSKQPGRQRSGGAENGAGGLASVAVPAAFDAARVSTAYGLAALQAECEAIQAAPFGVQEHTLNAAALKIGALVAGGELNRDEARDALIAAGSAMATMPGRDPWGRVEVERKVKHGMTDGERAPRKAPADAASDTPEARAFVERMMQRSAMANNAATSRLQADIRSALCRGMAHDTAAHRHNAVARIRPLHPCAAVAAHRLSAPCPGRACGTAAAAPQGRGR